MESEEKEMLVKKKELDQLKNEETLLVSKLNACKKDVDNLSSNLGQTQLQISQVKTQLVSLEEFEHQLTESSKDLTAAIASKDFHNLTKLLSRPLTSPPELESVSLSSRFQFMKPSIPFQEPVASGGFESDPFKNANVSSQFTSDPFAGEDPFQGGNSFVLNNQFKCKLIIEIRRGSFQSEWRSRHSGK